jgi:hypothetical protein
MLLISKMGKPGNKTWRSLRSTLTTNTTAEGAINTSKRQCRTYTTHTDLNQHPV